MEGPSLFLAAEQLSPFIGMTIKRVKGNTKIDKERLKREKILAIFPFGKQLFFQFDTFALRVHFLLWGTFQATLNQKKLTGDYAKKGNFPRLALYLENGHIEMYSCSVRFIETSDVKELCDFTIDTMSKKWDGKKALKALKNLINQEIGDVLLDQEIFAGVGNIIKNEVLFLAKTSPLRKIRELSTTQLNKIIGTTREYVFQFYKWRKKFELKKHYQVYRQSFCPYCRSKIQRKRTGIRQRFSYICPSCQK